MSIDSFLCVVSRSWRVFSWWLGYWDVSSFGCTRFFAGRVAVLDSSFVYLDVGGVSYLRVPLVFFLWYHFFSGYMSFLPAKKIFFVGIDGGFSSDGFCAYVRRAGMSVRLGFLSGECSSSFLYSGMFPFFPSVPSLLVLKWFRYRNRLLVGFSGVKVLLC